MNAKLSRIGPSGMAATGPAKVAQFLRGCFLRGQCKRIELRQITVRGTNRVYDWEIDDEPEETRTPEAFAEYVDQQATDDAIAMRGPTQYGVFVYREDQPEYSWRLIFSKRGEMAEDGSFAETEPPDATGLTSMAMRHAEAANRVALSMVMQLGAHYQRIMAQQETRLERFESRFVEMTELHENMSSRKDERDLTNMQARKAAEQKDRLIDQLQLLAPAALAKWLPTGEGKGLVAMQGVKEFMRSLKPEQVPVIMAGLNEAQQASLLQLYQVMQEQAEAEEKEGKK